jgi:hypothetical protein
MDNGILSSASSHMTIYMYIKNLKGWVSPELKRTMLELPVSESSGLGETKKTKVWTGNLLNEVKHASKKCLVDV